MVSTHHRPVRVAASDPVSVQLPKKNANSLAVSLKCGPGINRLAAGALQLSRVFQTSRAISRGLLGSHADEISQEEARDLYPTTATETPRPIYRKQVETYITEGQLGPISYIGPIPMYLRLFSSINQEKKGNQMKTILATFHGRNRCDFIQSFTKQLGLIRRF